jgi:hypothetical protein
MTTSTITTTLTTREARTLTNEVKQDAAALWTKLLKLYDGGAHTALSYSSWAEYCAEEFDWGKSHAYRVLDAARIIDVVPQLGNGTPEAVVREYLPVLRHQPEQLANLHREIKAEHGPKATAKQTREHVRSKLPREGRSKRPGDREREPERVTGEVVNFTARRFGPLLKMSPSRRIDSIINYSAWEHYRKIRQTVPSKERLAEVLSNKATRDGLMADLRGLTGSIEKIDELETGSGS